MENGTIKKGEYTLQVGEALNTVAGKLYDSDGNYIVDWGGIKTISSEDLPEPDEKMLTLGNLCEEFSVELEVEGLEELLLLGLTPAQYETMKDWLSKCAFQEQREWMLNNLATQLRPMPSSVELFSIGIDIETSKKKKKPENSIKRWKREKKYF